MKNIIRVIAGIVFVLGIIQIITQLTSYSTMAAGYGLTLGDILFREGAITEVLTKVITCLGFSGILFALSAIVGGAPAVGKAKASEIGSDAGALFVEKPEDEDDDDESDDDDDDAEDKKDDIEDEAEEEAKEADDDDDADDKDADAEEKADAEDAAEETADADTDVEGAINEVVAELEGAAEETEEKA